MTDRSDLLVFSPERTAELLDFPSLIDAVAQAALDYQAGAILSPARLVVPLGQGGVLLSMPATAADVGIHKLVSVQPANAQRQLPTLHGVVTVCDAQTGQPVCLLDGPVVTGRRTAAVSMLAVRELLVQSPQQFLLYGTGAQTRYHLQAIHALYPQARVLVRGRRSEATEAFVQSARVLHPHLAPCMGAIPDAVDVVIALTTSREAVYDEAPRPRRLVIGVGAFKPEMAEIGPTTLRGSDLYADDPVGAQHEAGDLLRAGVDWDRVQALGNLLRQPHDRARPAVFKSVGTAAWDLAAARVALRYLRSASPS